MTVPDANGFQERVSQPAPDKWWSRIEHAASYDHRLWSLDDAMALPPGTAHSVFILCTHCRDDSVTRPLDDILAELARFYRLSVEAMRRLVDAIARIGGTIGQTVTGLRDRCVTWAARQRDRELARNRQRRKRSRKSRDRRQLELLLPVEGGRDSTVTRRDRVRDSTVTRLATHCYSSEISPPLKEEAKLESEKVFKKEGDDPEARCARLAEGPAPRAITRTPVGAVPAGAYVGVEDDAPSPSSATDYRGPDRQDQDHAVLAEGAASSGAALPGQAEWLKRRKRDLLISKLCRFINATMPGETAAVAYAGLMADDAGEAQRWLDKLDLDMRARGWRDGRAA